MLAELTVPVVDQILAVILHYHALIDIGDIPYYLRHPLLMRIRRDPRDVNLACAKMDEEKDVVCSQPGRAAPKRDQRRRSAYIPGRAPPASVLPGKS